MDIYFFNEQQKKYIPFSKSSLITKMAMQQEEQDGVSEVLQDRFKVEKNLTSVENNFRRIISEE